MSNLSDNLDTYYNNINTQDNPDAWKYDRSRYGQGSDGRIGTQAQHIIPQAVLNSLGLVVF